MLKMIRNVYDCQEWGMLAILASVAMAGCNAQQTDSLQKTGEQVFKNEVIFSEVNGELVRDGNPIAGATITRRYSHDRIDGDQTEKTVTDSDGRFYFPEVALPKKFRGLFSEFRATQILELSKKDQDAPIILWAASKYDPARYSEYGSRRSRLICDSDNEYQDFEFESGSGSVTTKCQIVPESEERKL